MSQVPQLIQTPQALERACAELKKAPIVGLDTEFIRETTFFPRIALIQAATETEAWLIDPLAFDPRGLEPFLDILRDRKILKVLHAAFADQECLYWAYRVIAEPILDTAVAAALVGLGDNVGLGKLLKDVCHVSVAKGRARVKWLQRPLSRELLQYAEQDVAHLVRLGKLLLERLEKKKRVEWAMQESIVPITGFDTPPEDTATRMAKSGHLDPTAYNVLVELLRWRDDRAKIANLPRAWVAGNEILMSLAKVRPSTIEDLRSFRGLNAKEIDRNGERILAAIRKGKAAPKSHIELPSAPAIPTEHEDHVLDLIKTYVAYLAARHEVVPRYLMNAGKALALLRESTKSEADWVKLGILSDAACRLVGGEMKALLEGKRALVLRHGKVEILDLP